MQMTVGMSRITLLYYSLWNITQHFFWQGYENELFQPGETNLMSSNHETCSQARRMSNDIKATEMREKSRAVAH